MPGSKALAFVVCRDAVVECASPEHPLRLSDDRFLFAHITERVEILSTMVSQIPSLEEIESFAEEASEIARLVDGLRSGSLPPEYIDEKTRERNMKRELKVKGEEEARKPVDPEVKLKSILQEGHDKYMHLCTAPKLVIGNDGVNPAVQYESRKGIPATSACLQQGRKASMMHKQGRCKGTNIPK